MPAGNDETLNHLHRPIPSDVARDRNAERAVRLHPSLIFVYLFLGLIGVGALLLWQPLSTASGKAASFVDALFTTTSAVSTTGLNVVDTASYWSAFGQQTILGLIQLGGLVSLVGSSILLLRIARRATGQERSLLRESVHVSSGKGMAGLIGGVLLYALIVEAAGAWLLYRHLLQEQPQAVALWWAIFHSISAFNNAGFDVMGMSGYRSDVPVNLVLAGQSIVGGISFLVMVELVLVRRYSRLSLDSKLVLTATGWLLALGSLAILWGEFSNPATLGQLPLGQKLLAAFFHASNARTTGFSSLNVGDLAAPTLLVIVGLMFIGGASGSTAGGIKVNTFGVLVAATRSAVVGKKEVELLGGQAHEEQVNRAIAITFLSVLFVSALTFLLTTTDGLPLLDTLFEVVSAYSTTGYSMGITPQLSVAGKLLIVLGMFAGKVGPLTLAFALAHRRRMTRYTYAQEAINLG